MENDYKSRETVRSHWYGYDRQFKIGPHLKELEFSWYWMYFIITEFAAEVRSGNYGFGRDVKTSIV